jgi:hypothetical protein
MISRMVDYQAASPGMWHPRSVEEYTSYMFGRVVDPNLLPTEPEQGMGFFPQPWS